MFLLAAEATPPVDITSCTTSVPASLAESPPLLSTCAPALFAAFLKSFLSTAFKNPLGTALEIPPKPIKLPTVSTAAFAIPIFIALSNSASPEFIILMNSSFFCSSGKDSNCSLDKPKLEAPFSFNISIKAPPAS